MKKPQVQLKSVDGSLETDMNTSVIKDPSSASTKINWNQMKQQWDHLKSIAFPTASKIGGIDMLIGLTGRIRTVCLFLPMETVTGSLGDWIWRL